MQSRRDIGWYNRRDAIQGGLIAYVFFCILLLVFSMIPRNFYSVIFDFIDIADWLIFCGDNNRRSGGA